MFISDTAMPRKKNWRLSLAKKGNQSRASINDHGLVDPGHVNNRSELDPTSDITVNGPLRIVDPGHVKNRTRDLGDTASLKRVQNLPSGANNLANLPSGAQKCARLPSGAKKFDSLPSRAKKCASLHSGAQNIQNLPSGVKNSSDLDVNAQDEMNY